MDGGVEAGVVFDGVDGGVLIDFADEAGDDFAWADFEEMAVAHGDERADGFGPADGAGDLGFEGVADGGGVGGRGGGEVADDGDGGVLGGGEGELGGEEVLGTLHQAGVVGAGDVEFDGAFDAEFLGACDGVVDAFDGAGEDDLARGVEVGDIDVGGVGEFADLGFVAADEGGHGALGGIAGGFHVFAAAGDEAEAIGEREGASGGVGGEFAEGESGGGDWVEVGEAFAEEGEAHEAVEEEGGLAAGGFGEFLVRAFEHDGGEREAEGFVGLACQIARDGGGIRPILAHAHALGTLSGKQ